MLQSISSPSPVQSQSSPCLVTALGDRCKCSYGGGGGLPPPPPPIFYKATLELPHLLHTYALCMRSSRKTNCIKKCTISSHIDQYAVVSSNEYQFCVVDIKQAIVACPSASLELTKSTEACGFGKPCRHNN